MAFYRFQMGIIARSKGGSAIRRSAYQRCAQSGDGEFDYGHKADELISNEVLLPKGSPAEMMDPDMLWEAAEEAEKRGDAQVARRLEIAVPDAVPEHLYQDFARELMEFYVENGFAAEYSLQASKGLFRHDDNVHIHGMVSMRQMTEDGFASKKDRGFNQIMRKEGGHYMRRLTAEKMNNFFQNHGLDIEVDHTAKEDRDEVVPGAKKHVIKEIARMRDELEAHLAQGGIRDEFDKELTRNSQNFIMRWKEHRNAMNLLNEARKELERAFSNTSSEALLDVSEEICNATHDAFTSRPHR